MKKITIRIPISKDFVENVKTFLCFLAVAAYAVFTVLALPAIAVLAWVYVPPVSLETCVFLAFLTVIAGIIELFAMIPIALTVLGIEVEWKVG